MSLSVGVQAVTLLGSLMVATVGIAVLPTTPPLRGRLDLTLRVHACQMRKPDSRLTFVETAKPCPRPNASPLVVFADAQT